MNRTTAACERPMGAMKAGGRTEKARTADEKNMERLDPINPNQRSLLDERPLGLHRRPDVVSELTEISGLFGGTGFEVAFPVQNDFGPAVREGDGVRPARKKRSEREPEALT